MGRAEDIIRQREAERKRQNDQHARDQERRKTEIINILRGLSGSFIDQLNRLDWPGSFILNIEGQKTAFWYGMSGVWGVSSHHGICIMYRCYDPVYGTYSGSVLLAANEEGIDNHELEKILSHVEERLRELRRR